MSSIKGDCSCGKVQIEIPKQNGSELCHCIDCRKTGGGPASINFTLPRDHVKLSGETLKSFHKIGDSGEDVERIFCGDCGSHIMINAAAFKNVSFVRAGLFPPGQIPKPNTHFYTRNLEDWESPMPGTITYESQPDSF